MREGRNEVKGWTTCGDCQGRGKKSRRLSKKVRIGYQTAYEQFEKSNGEGPVPVRPKAHLESCRNCNGSGLLEADSHPIADTENYPHIAIIGAGIGGVALAVACLQRGIPFTIYERDRNFDARSQGYGLTLQQASKTIEELGIFALEDGVVSTRHLVHTIEGKIIGEWGTGKFRDQNAKASGKRSNIHIARQSLRLALLEQLGGKDVVQWNHQLLDLTHDKDEGVQLSFQSDNQVKTSRADLVVGADGIRSAVRRLRIGEEKTPLRYLGCIVILGICPLSALNGLENPLLDSATVFQTANGKERIYMMPYTTDSIMWQLSFPMPEDEAKTISSKGPQSLKEEACHRLRWHAPIPQILAATPESCISGYPVYDRELLSSEMLAKSGPVTLIGDAAHPMSPFKGQGANQALIDALALARGIAKGCKSKAYWKESGIRKSVLTEFETEMLARSGTKVKDSAAAAEFLHSEIVLHESDSPRGRCLKK